MSRGFQRIQGLDRIFESKGKGGPKAAFPNRLTCRRTTYFTTTCWNSGLLSKPANWLSEEE